MKKILIQPKGSMLCGPYCLNFMTGEDVQYYIDTIKFTEIGSSVEEMRKHFDGEDEIEGFPPQGTNALVYVRKKKKAGIYWHWCVVMENGFMYDPQAGIVNMD